MKESERLARLTVIERSVDALYAQRAKVIARFTGKNRKKAMQPISKKLAELDAEHTKLCRELAPESLAEVCEALGMCCIQISVK